MPGPRDFPSRGAKNNVCAAGPSSLPRPLVLVTPRTMNGITLAFTACLALRIPEFLRSRIP